MYKGTLDPKFFIIILQLHSNALWLIHHLLTHPLWWAPLPMWVPVIFIENVVKFLTVLSQLIIEFVLVFSFSCCQYWSFVQKLRNDLLNIIREKNLAHPVIQNFSYETFQQKMLRFLESHLDDAEPYLLTVGRGLLFP